jgi:signal transduction histidine kinase
MASWKSKKVLTLEVGQVNQDGAFLKISDTGEGIVHENLTRIFSHGFTTKKNGHGFGLHFCANSIGEMGGEIRVSSEGKGSGAQFTLLFNGNALVKKAA